MLETLKLKRNREEKETTIMSDTRERTSSTHEAYLKRVVIPPIMIPPPTSSQQATRAPIHSPRPTIQVQQQSSCPQRVISRVERRPSRLPPPENNLPTGAKGCLCGCAKITAGCMMCPFICSASCIAGACHGIYHAMTCNKYNDGSDPHRFCTWFGCYNACVISSTWVEEGAADMRRKPRVETEMVR